MNETKVNSTRRIYALGVFLVTVLLIYIGVMYDTQINDGDYYREQSIRTITRTETVEASRGIITDRNGQVMVSNRQTYALTFDASLLGEDDKNEAILRLIQLCRERSVTWNDNLPVTVSEPYQYTLDGADGVQRRRFVKFLQQTLKVVSTNVKGDDMTNALLSDIISPTALIDAMCAHFEIPDSWLATDARQVLGVLYELEVRNLVNTTAYVFADDVDTELISLIKDGNYRGVKVSASSVREYETEVAAHVLGYVGHIDDEELAANEGIYNYDDWIGKSGAELAFEEYLRGSDGQRLVSTNEDGKITSEIYTIEPKPGSSVSLTLDLNLQATAEAALAETITAMESDGNLTRGGGAAVIEVGSGEVLALASYPTFNLASYRQDTTELNSDPAAPLVNRATQGTYAPGSTFKPCTAVAALESGVVTLNEKIRDTGQWFYPNMIEGAAPFSAWCWNRGGHGLVNVTQAITVSCNYFFYEMGYRLGIERLNEYAAAFGLGQKTGIEIGEDAGILAGPDYSESVGQPWYGGNTTQAAIGQSDNLFTPLQLANYIATLVDGGNHYQARLLKSVKSYDNSSVVYAETPPPVNTVTISESTLEAVKSGMRNLTTSSLAPYFKNCVVDVGAKTGTAQISSQKINNGVFICFAPYDDPKIAVAIAIEKGGSGAALTSVAVQILNAYFSPDEISGTIIGENQLLP